MVFERVFDEGSAKINFFTGKINFHIDLIL